MTDIQVKYWTLQEDSRHNKASEQETQRHNVNTEMVSFGELQESIRHNTASENETYRSNRAREQETTRHNVAQEDETYRSNRAREAETTRSNRANESIKWASQEEAARHNAAVEAYEGAKTRAQARLTKAQAKQEEYNTQDSLLGLNYAFDKAEEAVDMIGTVGGMVGSFVKGIGKGAKGKPHRSAKIYRIK